MFCVFRFQVTGTMDDDVSNLLSSDESSVEQIARSLTLWEFLKLKCDCRRHQSREDDAAVCLAGMLSEIEVLQHHIQVCATEQLVKIPSEIDNPESASSILMVCLIL